MPGTPKEKGEKSKEKRRRGLIVVISPSIYYLWIAVQLPNTLCSRLPFFYRTSHFIDFVRCNASFVVNVVINRQPTLFCFFYDFVSLTSLS